MRDINDQSLNAVSLTVAKHPLVLALDIGTSSVRAGLYDAAARTVEHATARRAYDFVTTPDGGAERDADELLADVLTALAGVCAKARGVRVDLLAISCFWHSLVGVDADGRAVTPLYGWADTRARMDAEALRDIFDEPFTHRRTGCRFHATYWTAKLRWLHRTAPERTSEVARWLGFGEYLTSRLCGVSAASISMASATGLFDTHRLQWDAELARACGVQVSQLPLFAAPDSRWRVTAEMRARLDADGALDDVEVMPPIGDGAANNLGAGCGTESCAAVMIGTSAAMRVIIESAPPTELPASLWCYRLDERRIVVGGALSDGGGLRQWMAETLRFDGDAASLEAELAAMEPDAHGLTALPFWNGERSTGWTGDARGAILGLTMDVRAAELLRAAMEAVAYRLAEIADALRACGALRDGARLVASGGAINASPAWAQMLADVFGRNIEVAPASEASSRGAALLALERAGKLQAVVKDEATESVLYEPDAARNAVYVRARARQRAAYDALIADRELARLIAAASTPRA